MRLLHRITLHISIALLLLFAVWATLFYYIIVDEINDETDDSLEEYSEYIIRRALTGEKLPENDNGTNNSYHISKVTREYALQTPSTEFLDQTVYIRSKNETEPARIYKTIFRDKEDNYYQLTVTFPTFEKKDLKETILYWLILLYVLLLVSIIILNVFVHRRSLKPLYTMLKWLDSVQLSNTPPLLEVDTDITEFRKLSEALTRNACRNAEIYEQQSLFIAHASHELQTPIAIAQNRLEMLSNDSALTEAQLSQILKTKQAVESLSKLNKTLLLLARIENQQFPESEQIDVQKFLAPILENFADAYRHLGIRCTVEEKEKTNIRMNEMLATILFNNLIKNAYVHNRPNGSIHVLLTARAIRFSNTAAGEPLDAGLIFRRFYRKTSSGPGTGLGLALVHAICKTYNIEIDYFFEEGYHHFELRKAKCNKNS
ncbi:sensor histidine kinase KdpD [Bacteroides pyogenes]|uniref:histidine kinase n=4 Tax=Bacteroides TaxID=816 RepID=A0A5D3F1E4_9BACE|nr:HAMP domain-containing sensor histidine kinase [Bacteroides pyogenes]GAE14157.1 two-component system sensor histidine kinase [Bacteroides pyogenes JCM 6292]MCF2707623.1 HAMP domain-containing histidine kinase [Bacteroides pyogenes]MDY5433290.1 HAMP domain-containing sensor histidine kinase [Bacteroides pyogenes]TYK35340.1 HAMP domain-containing histidine kinase [Bacteroides pyogenes]TYK41809.1 HAMP domain-containing histidine kinase [Bacteroides pyogenes]